jgi:hypothetical protein
MDDTPCKLFFEQPACPAQRQYEALRALFLGGLSQKDAAVRFGYDYDAFRQLVHRFRRDRVAGNPPPFSPPMAGGGPLDQAGPSPLGPTSPTRPMSGS